MLTKDQLKARALGRKEFGTVVFVPQDLVRETVVGRVTYRAGLYVVKDLMNRKSFDRPGRIGIGRANDGLAFGVSLDEIVLP